jgi:energy-converting hydrogenase Eha subunit F
MDSQYDGIIGREWRVGDGAFLEKVITGGVSLEAISYSASFLYCLFATSWPQWGEKAPLPLTPTDRLFCPSAEPSETMSQNKSFLPQIVYDRYFITAI